MDYHSPTPVSSLIISNIFLRFFAFPSALWQISIPQILWIEINLPEAETFMKRNDWQDQAGGRRQQMKWKHENKRTGI